MRQTVPFRRSCPGVLTAATGRVSWQHTATRSEATIQLERAERVRITRAPVEVALYRVDLFGTGRPYRLELLASTLLVILCLAGIPGESVAQARVQPGDTVQFSLPGGAARAGRVVSVGSEVLTVLEGGTERGYPRGELGTVRVRRPLPGAGERAFWKGALVGGLLGGGAGLALALANLSDWHEPDPAGPTNAQVVLAVTSGGAMLGGLTFGIVNALLAPSHEWLSVGVAPQHPEPSVVLRIRIEP